MLTKPDAIKYDALFASADANGDGFVDGSEAKTFFAVSQLPKAELKLIWALADRSMDSKLDRIEFRMAMHLIYSRMSGYPLPPRLTPDFWDQLNK